MTTAFSQKHGSRLFYRRTSWLEYYTDVGIYFWKKNQPKPTNKQTNQRQQTTTTKKKNQNHTNSTTRLLSSLRVFSNLVACNFSKKLEFGPPARPHWGTVTLSFLGLVGLCLAHWQVCYGTRFFLSVA